MKFAVVFQGPIFSNNPKTGVLFHCLENIKEMVETFSNEVDLFVVSTWIGQTLDGYEHPKLKVVFNEDTITGSDATGAPLNNGPRKIVSSYKGVEAVSKFSDCEFVLVIRTDTAVNLEGVAKKFMEYNAKYNDYKKVNQKSFLHFLYMNMDRPYFATDFFIAGHVDDLLRFLSSNLKYLSIRFRPNKLIDVDWFIKYSYDHLSKFFQYPKYFNFPVIHKPLSYLNSSKVYPHDFVEYWNEITRHSVAPMPEQVFASIKWRGRKYGKTKHFKNKPDHDRYISLEGWDDVRGRWLLAAKERGISHYEYYNTGSYNHAEWYMIERYLFIEGSSYSKELAHFLANSRAK